MAQHKQMSVGGGGRRRSSSRRSSSRRSSSRRSRTRRVRRSYL